MINPTSPLPKAAFLCYTETITKGGIIMVSNLIVAVCAIIPLFS